jgi:polyhydroxybutyrate depolymerase
MSATAPNRVAPRRRHAPAAGARRALPPRRRALRGPRRLSLRASLVAAVAVLAALAATLPFLLTASPSVSAASPRTDAPAPVQPKPIPLEPGEVVGPGTPRGDSQRITLEVGGLERSYFLLPALGLAPGEEASLLVVLHQDVSSGREIAVDLGLDEMRRHGVTLAYPDGFGGSWNSGACCGIAAEKDVDDVGFVMEVLEDVGRRTTIDRQRRALLGYSGGGMLAYRLMCRERPDLMAVVEINGSLESHCDNGLELPDVLAVHGEKDGSVGLTASRFVNHLHMSPRPVVSTLTTVTGQAGCGEKRTAVENDVEVWRWEGCRGGGSVEAQIVPDAGHGWADVGGAERALAWLLPRLSRD